MMSSRKGSAPQVQEAGTGEVQESTSRGGVVESSRGERDAREEVSTREGSVAASVPSIAHAESVPSARQDSPLELDEHGNQVLGQGRNRRLETSHVVVEDREPDTQAGSDQGEEGQDPWDKILEARASRVTSTPSQSQVLGGSGFVQEKPEPEGTLGRADKNKPRLGQPVLLAWAEYPRDVNSFGWGDLLATGRADARIIHEATSCEQSWSMTSRSKWVVSCRGRYQVPSQLFSDRVFLENPLDAVYLERMHEFLVGKRKRPPITDPEFWKYDLPSGDSPSAREAINRLRSEWALSVGFKRIITFQDYEAMRDEQEGVHKSLYDVCTVSSRIKCTKFMTKVSWIPLPQVIQQWVGVMGLVLKIPRVLYYHGSECVRAKHYQGSENKLGMAMEFETLHATVCALYHDFKYGVAWILNEACLKLLEDNVMVVDVKIDGGEGISVKSMALFYREASRLPDDYLFERLDFPSQVRVRWAGHDFKGRFVLAKDFTGPRQKSYPVSRGRDHVAPGEPSRYVGGFMKQGSLGRENTGPSIPGHSRGSLHMVISDDALRASVSGEYLVRDLGSRRQGWSVQEILDRAFEIVRARDNTIHGLREERASLVRELDSCKSRREPWNDQGYGYHDYKRSRTEGYTPGYVTPVPSQVHEYSVPSSTVPGSSSVQGGYPVRSHDPYASYINRGQAQGDGRGSAQGLRVITDEEYRDILRRDPYADIARLGYRRQ